MCYEAISCPGCSSVNIVKSGKTAQQKQRYLSKDCRRQFIRDYTYLGCIGAWRALIVLMTMNGSGIRDIGRVLLVSPCTVLKTPPPHRSQNRECHGACARWNSMNAGRSC